LKGLRAGKEEGEEMDLFNMTYFGAALVALLLAILPAPDFINFKPFGDWQPKKGNWLRDLISSELGAVSVTYYARGAGITINGSTTNPTTTQGSLLQRISAVCVFGVTADVQALFTHNMGLDASAPGYFNPQVSIEPISTTTYFPLFTFWRANTNVLSINNVATDGPTTVLVTIQRGAGPF
jgi:hypothetical protein